MSTNKPLSWGDTYTDQSNAFRNDGVVLCKLHAPEFKYNEKDGKPYYSIAIEALEGQDQGKVVYKNIYYQSEWGPKNIMDIFGAIYGEKTFNEMKAQYWPTPAHFGKALEFLQAKLTGAVVDVNQVTGKTGYVNHYFKEFKETAPVEPGQALQPLPAAQPQPVAAGAPQGVTGSVTFADEVANNPDVF